MRDDLHDSMQRHLALTVGGDNNFTLHEAAVGTTISGTQVGTITSVCVCACARVCVCACVRVLSVRMSGCSDAVCVDDCDPKGGVSEVGYSAV